tara:strand:- start:834 stop:983 length:150 start_codon:yes stop_codon:yes gene_type:complete
MWYALFPVAVTLNRVATALSLAVKMVVSVLVEIQALLDLDLGRQNFNAG